MKKLLLTIVFLAVASGLIWLAWFNHAAPEEEAEHGPPTDVPVHVAKITRTTLRGYVTAYGTVAPEPSGEKPAAIAQVAAAVPGLITEVKCVEGQHVEKDAVLFQLDSRAADVAAEKAQAAVKYAEQNLERQQKLIKVEGTSQKLVLDAEQALATARSELAAAQTQQGYLRVTAPLSGTVVRINVQPGQAVDPTTALAEVIDLDRLVVSANVPSTALGALKAGQAVEVNADASAKAVQGSLTFIGSQVDPKTGTAPVRASLPAGCGLRPGQFVTVRIVSEEHKDRLAVPVESVVKNEDGETVIAIVQDDQASQKPVTTGLRDGGWVEVEGAGLRPDMTVITDGAYALPKATKVHVMND